MSTYFKIGLRRVRQNPIDDQVSIASANDSVPWDNMLYPEYFGMLR